MPQVSLLFFQKLRLCLLFSVLTVVSTLSHAVAYGADNSYSEYAPDVRRIISRGFLVVAMPKTDNAPFYYERNGQMLGLEVDIVRGFAKELGVQMRFYRNAKNQDEVIDVIAKGEADIGIGKLSRTFKRASKVRFSDPYLTMHHALALNQLRINQLAKGSTVPAELQRFSGSIAVLENTAYADLAYQNFPHAKIIKFNNWISAVSSIKEGRIDALYRDEFEIKRLIKSDSRNSLIMKTVIFTDLDASISFAMRHDCLQLLSLLNIYLSQETHPMTVSKLMKLLPTT